MLPPPDKIFAACTSIMATIIAGKAIFHGSVPVPLQRFLIAQFQSRFGAHLKSPRITATVEDKNKAASRNPFFDDAIDYIGNRASSSGKKIKVTRESDVPNLCFSLGEEEVISDTFEGIRLEYKFCKVADSNKDKLLGHEFIEICFDERHRDTVLNRYLPYVVKEASRMRCEDRVPALYTNNSMNTWEKQSLVHPSTFDKMAMNPELKQSVVRDIDLFVSRKEYYNKVGKAWKRGYLFHGPPGTGKSSLVATLANYLKFDIYELHLSTVQDDSSLRKVLLRVKNSSILVIEDLDRYEGLLSQEEGQSKVSQERRSKSGNLSMAALLNSLDGIWCSCFEERIIIVTTNHIEKLDPALLRPGRIDVLIEMGYCCYEGFKTLASTYLNLDTHDLFPAVERLMKVKDITPAQVAGELMKIPDADEAMVKFVEVLSDLPNKSRTEAEDIEYCSYQGFKTLASTYLYLDTHDLFPEVERLIKVKNITPAQVAIELMKIPDADEAMVKFVEVLSDLPNKEQD